MDEYETPFFVTDGELKGIHKKDRELFVRLVITMNRDPMQSMRIMALWLWMQQVGFPNIIERVLSLPDQGLLGVVDEAIRSINSLELFALPTPNIINLPMTQNLMGTPISINLIHHYRGFAITGIDKIINEVFLRVFNDIIEEARVRAANEALPVGNVNGGTGGNDPQGSGARVGSTSASTSASQHPSTGPSPPARRP